MSQQLELYTEGPVVTELYVGACARNDVELQHLGKALLTLVRYHEFKMLANEQPVGIASEACPK